MRSDRQVLQLLQRQPTQEEIEALLRRARRMRSEAVHGYLERFGKWLSAAFRVDRAAAKAAKLNRSDRLYCS